MAAALVLVHVGFISLGLPDGLLGTGWPSIRQTFGLPLDSLGALLLTTMAGYLLSSWSSGWVTARLGVGRLLAFSGFATALGLLGYAVAPGWWFMVGLGAVAGMGAGAIDAGLNAYVALHHSPRHLHWLHASYGVGAALGPLLMLSVLQAGYTWRGGYALVGAVQLVLGTCFLLTARRWGSAGGGSGAGAAAGGAGPVRWSGHRLVVVGLGVALFFVYTGVEATAGLWAFTLFTEGRGTPAAVAAWWVSVFWAGLTAGRILVGFIANAVPALTVLRVSMAGGLAGALLIWTRPSDDLSFAGLALMGLACAPIFPSLISATPGRLGAAYAARVIGFQVGASGLGIALLPGLTGIVAERFGLETIGLSLVLAALITVALHETLVHQSARL